MNNTFFLFSQLTRREIEGRYKGSLGGILWSFFYPLSMLAIYIFVFTVVFKSRWPSSGGSENYLTPALKMSVGILLHGMVAECISRAPTLMMNYANYVKKVRFPLGILPMVTVGAAVFHFLIGFTLLAVVAVFADFGVLLHLERVFAAIILLIMTSISISMILSAIGAYMRDIVQVTGIITSLLLFLSPCLYPMSTVPEPYRQILYLNPLTVPIIEARAAMFSERSADWGGLSIYALAALAGLAISWAAFKKLRPGFADVL